VDDVLAWTLDANGTWTKVPPTNGINAQRYLMDMAVRHSHPGFQTQDV
jgi:hypothetical protein